MTRNLARHWVIDAYDLLTPVMNIALCSLMPIFLLHTFLVPLGLNVTESEFNYWVHMYWVHSFEFAHLRSPVAAGRTESLHSVNINIASILSVVSTLCTMTDCRSDSSWNVSLPSGVVPGRRGAAILSNGFFVSSKGTNMTRPQIIIPKKNQHLFSYACAGVLAYSCGPLHAAQVVFVSVRLLTASEAQVVLCPGKACNNIIILY